MKKTIIAALLVSSGFSLPAFAQSAALPTVKSGDTWTYIDTFEKAPSGWRQTHDEVTVLRATPSHIYYGAKQAGSTQAANELIAGADWSRARNVNGTETVVNRPFVFPLSAGKTWDLEYTEQHPNKMFESEKWDLKYRVGEIETVDVPAGKFQAIKVEAEGQWVAEVQPTQTVVQGMQAQQGNTTMVTRTQKTTATPVTGRVYKAFWYVPEIGRWVKSVEEYYGSNGVRNERYTSELESFKRNAG